MYRLENEDIKEIIVIQRFTNAKRCIFSDKGSLLLWQTVLNYSSHCDFKMPFFYLDDEGGTK